MIFSSASTLAVHAAPARHGSVVIKRDDYGIPNIYADDTYSLFYGWGYALAEDRLFQIESVRHSSQGRAAEVFGPDYLELDKQKLTDYDPNRLKPQLATVTGEHRDALDGMVAGINKRIDEVMADPAHLMPKQFNDYGFKPQHWTDLDVAMSWVGILLFEFSDYTTQISNQAFLTDLKAMHGDAKAREIFAALRWKYDPSSPVTVPRIDQDEGRGKRGLPDDSKRAALKPLSHEAALAERRQSLALWQGTGPDKTPHASNTWLANRTKLVDADAMMVSGPQVGDHIPSMLWSAALHGAGINVTGLTYPGLPYFHYGTNGNIAWGRTALAGSVIDTYQEELNPANPHQYRYKGKWVDMEKRVEQIRVKGQSPVSLTLYRTVHGPVLVFDEANHTAYSKKRSWEGHEIETMFAYYDEEKANNYKEWASAISHKANNQNQYYADKDGNIAYLQAGRYPIRPKGFDIQLPTPGTGDREWSGIQPFQNNAGVLNPKQGYIDNWNNRPSPDVLNTDSLLWSRLDHVDSITERLEAKPKLTAQEIWDVNRWSSYAAEQQRYFVPLLKQAVAGLPAGDRARMVAEAIVNWNGQETDASYSGVYSSPGYTAFYGWLGDALTRFYEKDVPQKYMAGCKARITTLNCPYFQSSGAAVFYYALAEGKTGSPVPGADFLHGVKPADFIRQTLAETDQKLTAKYGPNIATWLSETRPKTWDNRSAMMVPWAEPSEKLTLRPNQKRGSMNAMYIFRNGKVTMCDAAPPGQSGFIAPDGKADPHYTDQQLLYTSFNCKPRHISEEDVNAHLTSQKRLTF
jgi:penicillin amidase